MERERGIEQRGEWIGSRCSDSCGSPSRGERAEGGPRRGMLELGRGDGVRPERCSWVATEEEERMFAETPCNFYFHHGRVLLELQIGPFLF